MLSRFFLTLSVIVEGCGLHPSTEILAKDLFDLVYGFRNAEISEVRVSVLCAVGTSLSLLRHESLLALLSSDSSCADESLAKYLTIVSSDDPDDHCRQLARDIYGTVANSVRTIQMG